MYIILTLIPLLAGCGDKKEAARGTMPVPEISVASPVVKDITLTKEYPGYLSSEKTVDLVARVNGTLQTHRLCSGKQSQERASVVRHRTHYLPRQCRTGGSGTKHRPSQSGICPEQLCPYAGSCEKRCCKPDTGVTVEIDVATFASGSQQRRSCTEYSTHKSGLLHSPGAVCGTVSRNQVDVGSYVGGSLQPVTLATIYKDDLLYTYFNITDNQWLAMLMQQGTAQQKDTLPLQTLLTWGKTAYNRILPHSITSHRM